MRLSFFNAVAIAATFAISVEAIQLQNDPLSMAQTDVQTRGPQGVCPKDGPQTVTKQASILPPHKHKKNEEGMKKGTLPHAAGRQAKVENMHNDEFKSIQNKVMSQKDKHD